MSLKALTLVGPLATAVLLALSGCSGKVLVNDSRPPADELVPGDDNGTTGACNDGIQNGTETGVDCGGGCPAKCGNGSGCAVDGDCQSNSCNGTTCMPATCGDGRQNGFETSVDCGGPECVACGTGSSCTLPSDCTSHVCSPATGQCAAASCTDGVMNGDETGVDCGGSCADLTPAKTCATGHGCTTDDDCVTHVCQEGICRVDTCKNGFKDGDEVGVDCGGPKCGRCDVGKECETSSDCLSGVCLSFQCQASTCTDGVKNQDESDVDCGGSCAANCLDGGACNANTDCASNLCVTDRCRPTGCANGVQDGDETGVDCGGPCAACGTGGGCTDAADCASGVCTGLVCQAPTCSDGIENGDETGIDCGYLACSVSCGVGSGCENDYDCTTHACDLVTHRCLSPTCTDGRRNGDETGIDCGGSECSGCGTGSNCQNPGDCTSGVCTGGTCQPPTCTDTVLNGDETGIDCGGSCALNEGLTCPAGGGCLIEEDCSSPLLCLEGTCSPATCTNTAIDPPNGETDVDCGGTECPACANGKHCGVNRDCQSQVCGVGASCASPPCTCQAPSCVDGVKNGDEVDVDCGYIACGGGCDVGDVCARDQDCQSLVCATGRCQPPSCFDTVQNGTETGPDCGGACVAVEGFTCPDLSGCLNASDCESGVCTGGVCQHPSCAPADGVKNGNETGIDCGGGGSCPTCGNGAGCRTNGDCTSGVCSGLICQVPRCSPPDGVQNGTETDTDCGGAGCPKCADTKKCSVGGDCVSAYCGSNGRCQPAGCNDTVKNGTETDVDCGGSVCSKCDIAGHCLVPGDCLTGVCTSGTSPTCTGGGPCCQSPSCSDTVKNGDEGDVDCGGAISGCRRCNPGEHCNLAADCASSVCVGGICQAPRCGDGIKSGSEVCDDGNTLDCVGNGTIFCKHDCTALIVITGCGDGYVCGTEECDDANSVNIDNCRNDCRLASCGDGLVSTGATGGLHETCDDGTNDGSYGTCMPDCSVAPFCGDAHIDAPNETCDDGVNDGDYGTCRPNCRLAPYCGDGKVSTPPEACDDGGTSAGDGCNANCTAVEATWFCPTPGAPCLKACGNGRFDTGEACDDGGKCTNGNACTIGGAACSDASPCLPRSSDGCSATCTVEAGWSCPRFGQACVPLCGNGVIDGSEACDDGGLCDNNSTRCRVTTAATDCAATPLKTCTTRSSDGCTATCGAVESGWECPVVGQPCNRICGNGRIDPGEACDFGNGVNPPHNVDNQYNGCNTNCTLGPKCGDATVNTANGEECDLGGKCTNGVTCTVDGLPCADLSVCVSQNTGGYGGCRADCTYALHCGDGVITPGESCEDGGKCNNNTTSCTSDPVCQAIAPANPSWECTGRPGDGCSGSCVTEANYICRQAGQPCTLASLCGNGVKDGNERCDDGKACADGTRCTLDSQCVGGAGACAPRSGDGCDSTCSTIETGWVCPNVGQACAASGCGDGYMRGYERCDDGNTAASDGCSPACRLESRCGNGIIDTGEQCDIGGQCSGDSARLCFIDATCKAVNAAWTCVPRTSSSCTNTCQLAAGQVCATMACGNGNCELGECATCPADCSGLCTTPCGDGACAGAETSSSCASDCGSATQCRATAGISCGNGILEGTEQCDDYNTTNGDGCSSTCAIEPVHTTGADIGKGHVCYAVRGVLCGTGSGNGNCPCTHTTCGDGVRQGGEACDDGKHCGDTAHTPCRLDSDCTGFGGGFCVTRAGDGCGPFCSMEPMFECSGSLGQKSFCRPTCGDGKTLVAVGEACDDGNVTSGDGCSSSCTIENGWTCTDMSGLPTSIGIPLVIRDFRGLGDTDGDANQECTATAGLDGYATDTSSAIVTFPENELTGRTWNPRYCGHFDMQHVNACTGTATVAGVGLVQSTLTAGKPVFLSRIGSVCTSNQLSDQAHFSQWYVTTANVNKEFTKPINMVLTNAATRTYTYDSNCGATYNSTNCNLANGCNWNGTTCQVVAGGFFPLNHCASGYWCDRDSDCTGHGGGTCQVDGYGNIPGYTDCAGGTCHNFGFTTEWHTYFQYNGGEMLSFSGDDDVWVFINGVLAVDIGGRHAVVTGSVTLSNAVDATLHIKTDARFNIYEKGIYEIAFFQAERHTSGSNFKLTLSGFLRSDTSTCTGVCGNGIAQAGEQCDDGNAVDTDSCHNNCTLNGTSTGVCGNQALDAGEQCDDGNAINTDNCANCQNARCGDGYIQAVVSETCDDGALNGTYNHCALGCQGYGPRCGDGILQTANGEVCDDGINDGAYGTCMPGCGARANYCGDAVRDPTYEDCDFGVAGNNGSPPNRCAANCTSTAACGDGYIDAGRGEICDNGAANNDATYNGCKTNCQLGPRCGDGVKNGSEVCDDGTNTGAYGGCMAGCGARGPYCGDNSVNGSEQCDNGTNNGSYGTCNPDCTRAARCGDAQLDLGREQCDLGTANNTGAYGTCNSNCTLPAYCGDAIINGAEACDDGVNSGAYNTCNANCTLPARCGDVIVQTTYGEQCDDGVNDATYNGCRANCHWAPYCGDGAIQTQTGGEQCDSGILGGRTCSDLDGDGRTGEPGDFDGGTLACVNGTCQLNTAGCYRCGDGVRNGFEVCDGIGLCGATADCGGLQCEDLGFPSTGGLACLADCTFDLTGCNAASCGNGILDSGEQCDMAELGTRKCNDLDGDGVTNEPGDFSGGLLACTTSCTLDTSGCYYCGDGVRNGTELCDGSDTGGATCISVNPGLYKGGTLSCNATCNGFDFSGCWLCTGCGDCDGQACADHHCGFCSKDSDCCAPLLCQPWGECALF